MFASAPAAADWDITPAVSVTEAFTDNLGLRTDTQDRNSDFVTSVAPGVSVRGAGARVNLNLDYALERVMHLHATEQDDWRNYLRGTGSAELWDQVLFLDGQVEIARRVIETQAPISQSVANIGINRAETTTWSIGPRFLHHFGTFAETESRITRRSVSSPSRGRLDATIDQQSFVMNSGRRFTQLLWSLTGESTRTSRDERPHILDRYGRADVTYVLNREVALLAGLGWETIEDATLREEPNGPIWSIGTQLTPGHRTTFKINYNYRYQNQFLSFSGEYRPTNRTTISVGYDESLRSASQVLAENPLAIQLVDGALVGRDPTVDPIGEEDDTFLEKRFTANLTHTSGRNRYNVQVYVSQRTTDLTQQESDQSGAVLTWNRSLTHVLDGTLSVNYRRSESTQGTTVTPGVTGSGTVTHILSSASLTWRLNRNTDAILGLGYAVTDGGDPSRDSSEKSAAVTLRRRF